MARATSHFDRERQLTKATETLEKKLTELKRLVTSIRMWQRRVKYYTAQVHMTDEERAAIKARQGDRASKIARRHRRIKL
jgi:hypothetical protein